MLTCDQALFFYEQKSAEGGEEKREHIISPFSLSFIFREKDHFAWS